MCLYVPWLSHYNHLFVLDFRTLDHFSLSSAFLERKFEFYQDIAGLIRVSGSEHQDSKPGWEGEKDGEGERASKIKRERRKAERKININHQIYKTAATVPPAVS